MLQDGDLRQIESTPRRFPGLKAKPNHMIWMTELDPIGARIAATFRTLDVHKARGGYTLTERRSGKAVARLKPWPDTDRFELFYWSHGQERWKTFGDFGRLKLDLEDAAEIMQAQSIFCVKQKGILALIFG